MEINVEQLKNGKPEGIDLTLPSDFLEIHEKEIFFTGPVHLKGQAYAADDHLILQLSAETEIKMACSICNKMTRLPLNAQEIFYSIPFDELKSTIFDFTDIVREEIILLIPQFVECQEGKCPERAHLSPFMKDKSCHFPFADL
jgi:uncharacterized metal-binding protein YceD (DUF177 family)